MIKNSIAIGCAVTMLFAISACESTEATPTSSGSNKNQAVFNTLFDHFDYRFPMEQNCSDEETVTIRDFTAHSLGYISEQRPEHGKVEAICNAVKADSSLTEFYSMGIFPKGTDNNVRGMDGNDSLMQCQVSFSVSHQELVWSRAIQFLWDKKTANAVKNTFRCVVIP